MKKIFILVLAMVMSFGAFAQTLTNLAYFPFTGNQATPNTPTSYLSTNGEQAGTAGLYLDGTHGSSSWASDELTSNNGSTLNAQYGVGSDKDLATINQSANGKSIVFHFSTAGYQNVIMTMAARRSTTGFNSTVWAYSTDGTNFTTLPNFSTTPDTVNTYRLQTLDFTGVPALNDQPNVYLRCTYNGATANNGSFRIDNVLIAAASAGPDVWGPMVASVIATDTQTVNVTFNELVSTATAENVANYVIDNNITVTAAALTGTTVTLTTSPFTPGDLYSMIISNVADTTGNVMTPDTVTFSYGVSHDHECATIAELRSKWPGTLNIDSNLFDNVVYKLTGEVIVTGVNESYRHQTFIQDATGAIVIDDNSHLMSTYNAGDKISGIMGKLTCYYGMLQFSVTEAYTEDAMSVYNSVEPLVVTVSDIQDVNFMNNHQAELLRMNNVTFSETGDIENNGKYTVIQDGQSANCVWIHFWNVTGLSGTPIPTIPVSLIGVNKINYGSYYLIPRKGEDLGTGVAQYLTENDLVIYPNPVTDQLNVSLRTDKYQVTRVAIYDINGKLVCSQPVEDNHVRIDVQGFSAGTYFLRLSDGKNMITTKFIKK